MACDQGQDELMTFTANANTNANASDGGDGSSDQREDTDTDDDGGDGDDGAVATTAASVVGGQVQMHADSKSTAPRCWSLWGYPVGGYEVQYWSKPLPGGAAALYVLNTNATHSKHVSIDLKTVLFGPPAGSAVARTGSSSGGSSGGGEVHVRDIWEHSDMPALKAGAPLHAVVPPADSVFYKLTPATPSSSSSSSRQGQQEDPPQTDPPSLSGVAPRKTVASKSDDDTAAAAAAAAGRLHDGSLFALDDVPGSAPSSSGSFRLVTINLTDGTRTPVSRTGVEIQYTPGRSTIDRNHSVLYYIGQLKHGVFTSCNLTLVGISLVTGAMVSNATIPGADALRSDGQIWTAGIAYAEDLDKLVLSISTSAHSHIVGTMHPTTGAWETLATIPGANALRAIGDVQPASMVSYAMSM
eukprot:COSAG06_NODE_5717_length_3308_cov_1.817700_2_plen_413_part_00